MKTNETDIPTQQNTPQKITWLSSSHENSGWTQSDQPQAQSGPQEISSLKFPKDARLKSKQDFQRVVREKKRLVGRFLCIDYKRSRSPRLGISAAKRYGSSPERNRFKRLVREAFRQSYPHLPPMDLNVVPRQCAKKANCQEIMNELRSLLK
jgi:ribonuclease P protein component